MEHLDLDPLTWEHDLPTMAEAGTRVEYAIAEAGYAIRTLNQNAANAAIAIHTVLEEARENPCVFVGRHADPTNREHVEFAMDNPERLSDRIRHAGAIFLGRVTPEAIGDYVAGSNHVLPTSRAARFQSGLSIYDFLKRTSIVKCDAASFGILGPHTVALAQAEGLPAHALSASIRLPSDRLPSKP
jgi:histidinol dehydrogenase